MGAAAFGAGLRVINPDFSASSSKNVHVGGAGGTSVFFASVKAFSRFGCCAICSPP